MGILTGALLAGLCGKFLGKRKKKNTDFEGICKFSDIKKIVVIGCAGSGKTYTALKLQEKLDIPVYHLDQYAWKPGWEKVEIDELRKEHKKLLEKDLWIIEGIYLKLLHDRVEASEAVIFLDIPRAICLWNVVKRSVLSSGKVIKGNPEGCTIKIFSFKFIEFLKWIWNFNNKHRPKVLETLNTFKDTKKIYIFTSHQEVTEFLSKI